MPPDEASVPATGDLMAAWDDWRLTPDYNRNRNHAGTVQIVVDPAKSSVDVRHDYLDGALWHAFFTGWKAKETFNAD